MPQRGLAHRFLAPTSPGTRAIDDGCVEAHCFLRFRPNDLISMPSIPYVGELFNRARCRA